MFRQKLEINYLNGLKQSDSIYTKSFKKTVDE